MTIESLRKFIIRCRVILWICVGVLTPFFIWATIAIFNINKYDDNLAGLFVLAYVSWIVVLVFAFGSLTLKLKTYRSDNHIYTIYVGFRTDVLFCDGEDVDVFSGSCRGVIELEHKDEQGEEIYVRIRQVLFNSCDVIIDGAMVG